MTTYSADPVDPAGPAPADSDGVDILFVQSTFPTPSLMPAVVARRRAVATAKRRTGVALLLVLLTLGLWFGIAKMQLATAQSNLAVAQAELRDAERLRDQYRDVPAVITAVKAARAELAQAMGGEIQVARLTAELSGLVPPGVSLKSISLVTGEAESATSATAAKAAVEMPIATVSFAGEGEGFNDVSAWIDTLRNQPDYQNVILTEVSRDPSTGIYSFACTAELSDQSLSGRFVLEEQ
jgi:Tfp pilus assembly protein PilN